MCPKAECSPLNALVGRSTNAANRFPELQDASGYGRFCK